MTRKLIPLRSGYEFPKGAEDAAPMRVIVSQAALRTISGVLDKAAIEGGVATSTRLRLMGLAELLDGVRKALDLHPDDEYLVGFKRMDRDKPRARRKSKPRRTP